MSPSMLIGGILLPIIGGWLSTVCMIGQVRKPGTKAWYQVIKKPSWTPPNWAFTPVWVVLYTAMGAASYVIYKEGGGFTDKSLAPLALYGVQLVLNWTWTPIFFGLHRIGLALAHMLVLDVAALLCTLSFLDVSTRAPWFMLPYLGWLTFATCLNYTIWKLNKKDYVD